MADTLQGFAGFSAGKTHITPLPNEFFGQVLPIIDNLAELKAILYLFWKLSLDSGDTRYLRLNDALNDLIFLAGMGKTSAEQEKNTRAAFKQAAQRGVLKEIEVKRGGVTETWYFLNSPKGRQAVEKLRRGDFRGLIHDIDDVIIGLERERPNVFLLYEQNIGMVTPMLAEKLRQAERDYPQDWITEAFSQAVEHNKRSWAYIHSILRRWSKDGKDTPSQTRRPAGSGHSQHETNSDEPGLFILE